MREITVNDKTYTYQIGTSSTVIRLGKLKWVFYNSVIAGLSPYDFERGQYKRNSDGMVTPSDIRKAILNLPNNQS